MSTQRRDDYTYVGSELELFAAARNWKAYLRKQLTPYLQGRVLEVGAGLGTTTRALAGGMESEWVGVEPDPSLAAKVKQAIDAGTLPAHCHIAVGTLETASLHGLFDAVLYIDVLEHIENDSSELVRASRLVSPGGHVIVLAPAHQWLYSPFDRAIGHFRRYSQLQLEALAVPGASIVVSRYLDAAGLLASVGNKVMLRRSMPTAGQISTWDRFLVPVSRVLDPVIHYKLGKSVLVIWQKR